MSQKLLTNDLSAAEAKRIPLERFLSYDKIHAWKIAPKPGGDAIAIATDASGQMNIWLYSRDGRRTRLTPFTERRAFPVAWSYDGSKLLFESDYQGNEEWQLYLYDASEGWFTNLVFEEGVVHMADAYCWSPDGSEIAFLANREEKSRFDLYVKDLLTGREKFIVEGFGGYQRAYWLPLGMLFVDIRSHEDTSVYLVDMKERKLDELTPHEEEALFVPIGPWKDGFFMLTDEGREFAALAYYSMRKRGYKVVWKSDWDIEHGAVGKNYLLFSLNEEAVSKLYSIDLRTMAVEPIAAPEGEIDCIMSVYDTDVFFASIDKATRPADIYVVDLEVKRTDRVTDAFYGGIPEEELAEPESVWYETFDGRRVHALIYRPRAEGKVPVVLWLHGGPQAQSKPAYSPLFQYLVHRGVAVALPNFRGSTGYGKSFRNLIRRDWGGGELKDVEYFIQYLLSQPWVDSERLGVAGGSFGGFLTLSCVTRLPEYWRVAVDWFGPSNLVTSAKVVPPYWKRYMRDWVGDPEDPEDRKMLEGRSPIKYVDNVRCPILVIQGAKDIRVVKQESDQIVEKLRGRDIKVEYVVFEDEGHGFTKEANFKKAVRETAEFLLKHLLH